MNKTLLFLLLPGLLISCKPTPPSGDNGEIVPLTSECLLKNSDLYMKYPYKIKVQDSIMCIWDLHGGDRFYHLYSYPELQFITSFAVNGRGPEAIFELPRIADLTIKTLQSVLVYSVTKKASIIALARSELI